MGHFLKSRLGGDNSRESDVLGHVPRRTEDKGIQDRKAEEAKPGSDFRQHAAFARSQREALEKKLHPRIDPDLSIEN